ncbi:MAG: hypothetical protein WD270_04505 [Acetobacterales bacterium]
MAAFWVRYLCHASWRIRLRPQLAALRHLQATTTAPLAASPRRGAGQIVLVVSYGDVAPAVLERVMLAGFECAGYRPTVLVSHNWPVRKAYRWLGIDDFVSPAALAVPAPAGAAESISTFLHSQQALRDFEIDGVKVGTYAAATMMRLTRSGNIDLSDDRTRGRVAVALGESLDALDLARAIFEQVRPGAILLAENAYTPFGEIFDLAVVRGVPVFLWNTTQSPGTLSIKRFHAGNAREHPYAISPATWERARTMQWTAAHERRLFEAMDGAYASGQWFASVGTQFDTRFYDRDGLAARLGLDPAKKTAVVFPHMFWDATFAWGEDLFDGYEDWFCRTLQTAAANGRLNWVIKVHPANRVKSARDGAQGEYSEMRAISRVLGTLPPHIRVIEPETDVNTLSVFALADYCLTVRGTVGIEAACRGIRTLTAGTGRYDRRGFTTDFDQIDTYLTALARLHELPPMPSEQVELARRFAYASFIGRSVPLESVDFAFRKDSTATMEASLRPTDRDALLAAPDARRIGDWIASGADDLVLDDAF